MTSAAASDASTGSAGADTPAPSSHVCTGCEPTQRAVAIDDAPRACFVCGQLWEPVRVCPGCADARAHLERTRDTHGHRNPRAWLRCDECQQIVALDARGLQSALDVTVRRGREADARMRRKTMLLALDNQARWKPYIEGHATEASPIVGDGNRGGGAKLATTDRPDWVTAPNDDPTKDPKRDLAHAIACAAQLESLAVRARAAERWRAAMRDAARAHQLATGQAPTHPGPSPTAYERGFAVLCWIAERTGSGTRKDLVYQLGLAFGGRAAAVEEQRQLADLVRRKNIVPPKPEAVALEREKIRADAAAAAATIREERIRIVRDGTLPPEERALSEEARERGLLECWQARVAVYVARARDLAAIDARVAEGRTALTAEQFREEVAKVKHTPAPDAIKQLGRDLLALACRVWEGTIEGDPSE